MFVASRMAKNPITVTPETTLVDASGLMKKYHIRRLPVVEKGKLVGFLNDKELMRVAPSPATTLSRYEMRSLLDKISVRDIMQRNPVTVSEEATIEEAALLMYNHRISALPVVSSVGAVVGVITETDIFKTFVDVMGLVDGKTRLTIEATDKVGVVKEIAGIFAENGLSLDSLVTCKQPAGRYEIVIRGDIPAVDDIVAQIEGKGYNVIHVAKIAGR